MLYSIDTNSYVWTIPHREEYEIWRSRISDHEYEAIIIDLHNRINTDEIHASSWTPGQDWTNTVYEPIYEKACRYDEKAAARFFNLILWTVLLERSEVWGFGHYRRDGVQLDGLTYFRLGNPP